MGATFFMWERVGDHIFRFHFVITEWIEHRILAFRMTSGNLLTAFEQRWTIDPIPGVSRFFFHDRAEFAWGPLGKLIGVFFKQRSNAACLELLARFKNCVETS